ncbi:MAG: DUF2007 domain-containing protein [Gemmatimonadales bacterium]
MLKVFVAADPAEAHLCLAVLESEGIEAIIQGEYLSSIQGGVPCGPATNPTVWILDAEDAERAAGIVARFAATTR